MSSSDAKSPHVLIIGAGTSGLLIAQGLKKNNIPYTIFEASSSSTYQSRPREWGMTLHWAASHIASCLPDHLVARFNEVYADPSLSPDAVTGLPIYNGKTGELIMEMGADRPCRVSRGKMRGLCGDGVEVRWGKKFVGAREVEEGGKVEVEFEDGEKVQGDVLVGCDGAKSKVRAALVGEKDAELADAGVGMFNFPYKFDAELARKIREMNKLFITSIHPDSGNMFWLSTQDIPSPDSNPSTWTFQVLLSFPHSTIPPNTDLSTQQGRMSFFKSRGSTYAEPWRSACAQVSPDTYLPLDQTTYWANARAWPNHGGKMTLCGDAAHPMTPHRGQGLNNAVLDSVRFVEAMVKVRVGNGGEGLEEVVGEYDKEVLERGKAEMEVSFKQTRMIHDWETLMESPMVRMGMRQKVEKDG